jgi:hypothetical protein
MPATIRASGPIYHWKHVAGTRELNSGVERLAMIKQSSINGSEGGETW